MRLKTIAIFGGSFDPVHLGHVQIAHEIQTKWCFDHFIFLPCGQSALKEKYQSKAKDRLAMLELALSHHPEFEINTFEILQPNISYTINSLIHFRNKWGNNSSISFILGEDAMAQFMRWKEWEKLLDYAHFIYHQRPLLTARFSKRLQTYIDAHLAKDKSQIKAQKAGFIYPLPAQEYPYSSTQIRQQLQSQGHALGLDPKVQNYITQHHLYHDE